jgi:3-oxoadipate CoA-transferase beta subunit
MTRHELSARVARDIPSGSFVNLGIGQPTLVADYLPADAGITLHTENGMLGMGRLAVGEEIDRDRVNAGKQPVTELPGASYFDHAESFAMMRGGHLDYCVLGAFQVSQGGDLANWSSGEPDSIPAVGGAMDLASGAKNTFAMMTLFDKQGRPKLLPECTFPLTGIGCVSRVYTDLATFLLGPDGVTVRETFGVDLTDLRSELEIELREPGAALTGASPTS